jgi:hypothetical protein
MYESDSQKYSLKNVQNIMSNTQFHKVQSK